MSQSVLPHTTTLVQLISQCTEPATKLYQELYDKLLKNWSYLALFVLLKNLLI